MILNLFDFVFPSLNWDQQNLPCRACVKIRVDAWSPQCRQSVPHYSAIMLMVLSLLSLGFFSYIVQSWHFHFYLLSPFSMPTLGTFIPYSLYLLSFSPFSFQCFCSQPDLQLVLLWSLWHTKYQGSVVFSDLFEGRCVLGPFHFFNSIIEIEIELT